MVTPNSSSTGGTVRLGIALSATELVVAAPHAMRIALDPQSDSNTWPSLTDALRVVATRVGGGGSLSIALGAPLVSTRTIDLPPIRARDAEVLLSRTAARYFVGARGPQVIAISAQRSSRGSSTAALSRVVSASPLRTIAGIHAAVRDAGWTVQSIAPHESAWASATVALWPALARLRSGALVLHADHIDLLLINSGALTGVRRFRPGTDDVVAIAAALREHVSQGAGGVDAIRVAMVGAPEQRKALARALSANSAAIQAAPPALPQSSVDNASELAAAFAPRAGALRLRTDDERVQQDRQAQRIAMMLGSAAALMLVVAGVFMQWGVSRELEAVQRERAALKQQLSVTVVGRTSVETAYRQLGALNDAERTASHWSPLIAAIATRLDSDAYVTTFRGRGDSVVVDGIAARASTVFDNLAQTPGLADVRAAAPVRREVSIDGEPSERFTIAARLKTVAPTAERTITRGATR